MESGKRTSPATRSVAGEGCLWYIYLVKFRFTHHAEYRMFMERGISADDIKKVIQNPESVVSLPNGAIKCFRKIEKGVLVVVYSRDKNIFVIITAYFK